jgi:hypothetical protein
VSLAYIVIKMKANHVDKEQFAKVAIQTKTATTAATVDNVTKLYQQKATPMAPSSRFSVRSGPLEIKVNVCLVQKEVIVRRLESTERTMLSIAMPVTNAITKDLVILNQRMDAKLDNIWLTINVNRVQLEMRVHNFELINLASHVSPDSTVQVKILEIQNQLLIRVNRGDIVPARETKMRTTAENFVQSDITLTKSMSASNAPEDGFVLFKVWNIQIFNVQKDFIAKVVSPLPVKLKHVQSTTNVQLDHRHRYRVHLEHINPTANKMIVHSVQLGRIVWAQRLVTVEHRWRHSMFHSRVRLIPFVQREFSLLESVRLEHLLLMRRLNLNLKIIVPIALRVNIVEVVE